MLNYLCVINKSSTFVENFKTNLFMKKLSLNYYEFLIKLLFTIVIFALLYFTAIVAYFGINFDNTFTFTNVLSHILFILTVLIYTVLLKMIWKKRE